MIRAFTGVANNIARVKDGERALTSEELSAANHVYGSFSRQPYAHMHLRTRLKYLNTTIEREKYSSDVLFAFDAIAKLRFERRREEIETTYALAREPEAAKRLQHVGEVAARIRAACLVPVLLAIGINSLPEDAPNPQETNQSSIQGSLRSSMSDN